MLSDFRVEMLQRSVNARSRLIMAAGWFIIIICSVCSPPPPERGWWTADRRWRRAKLLPLSTEFNCDCVDDKHICVCVCVRALCAFNIYKAPTFIMERATFQIHTQTQAHTTENSLHGCYTRLCNTHIKIITPPQPGWVVTPRRHCHFACSALSEHPLIWLDIYKHAIPSTVGLLPRASCLHRTNIYPIYSERTRFGRPAKRLQHKDGAC